MSNFSACPDGNLFINSSGMKLTLSIQVFSCIAAVIANVFFIFKNFQNIYFHYNIKTIILFGLANNIIHSILLMVLQAIHLIMYCMAQTPCDVYVSAQFCLSLRGPITIFGINNIPLGAAIVTERLVASLRLKTYEEEQNRIGLYLSLGATAIGTAMVLISQKDTPLTGVSAYCSAVNKFTADSITMWSYIQVVAEILSIMAFLGIWWMNIRAQKRKSYNVKIGYQIHENLSAFKLLFPWMMLHLICFLSFHAANAAIGNFLVDPMDVRIAYAAAYEAIPIYCLLSPFLLSWIVYIQKNRRQKTIHQLSMTTADAEAYENYLSKDWY